MALRFGRRRDPRAAFRYIAEDAPSGYGEAGDRLVVALRAAGVPVEYRGWSSWNARDLDAQPQDHRRDPLPSERAGRHSPTVAHLVPEHLPNVRRAVQRGPLISHTVWETDRLPAHWPSLLNAVDRVVVPTEWNREVFVASGVTAPVVVVPHVVCDPVPGDLGTPLELARDVVVFYTIARWDQRKAPAAVIRAYLDAFTTDDPVALVVKTSPDAQFPVAEPWGSRSGLEGTTLLEVARIIRRYRRPASVRIEVEDWEPSRVAGLHTRGDCYVSLTHGEGWGLGAFDAAAYGNPVVITGWGGHLDFLDADRSLLVDFDLEPVEHWEPRSYGPEQHWAIPHHDHAVELLREVAADITAARRRAAPLRASVLNDFAPARVAVTLLDVVPELETAVETTTRRRGTARKRADDLLLVGLAVGPWQPAYDNWVEMAERYGYRYEILGREIAEPYIPHATKWRVLLDYFADQPRDRVAFYLDAADGFVCDTPAITLRRYRSYAKPLVFGAEASSSLEERFDVPDPTWRYGNSGGYIGEAGVIADALREGYELVDWDLVGRVRDQWAMLEYVTLPQHRHLATVDHRRVLVQNIARAPHYQEREGHRSTVDGRSNRPPTSSVHFYGDNGPGYNTFAELYGMAPVPLQESGRFRSSTSPPDPRPRRIKTDQLIPRILHFVFGMRNEPEPFHLVHYLAVRSCLDVVQPDEVYLHCHHLPFGPYWRMVEPLVRVARVDPVRVVSELEYADPFVARYSYAHQADFVRLDVLANHGGIYADIDTLFVAPIPDDLWRERFVIGQEADALDPRAGASRPALSNALLMSAPGSRFVEAWRAEIAEALDGNWTSHSCFLAYDLATRMPDDVHVEPQRRFHEFEPTPAGLSRLLEKNEKNLDGIVSIHLAAHLWWENNRRDFSRVHAGMVSEEWIRHAPVTYATAARRFLPER